MTTFRKCLLLRWRSPRRRLECPLGSILTATWTAATRYGSALATPKNTNIVTQMYDPWVLHSANTHIAMNGQRAQTAAERYRYGKVIAPARHRFVIELCASNAGIVGASPAPPAARARPSLR